MLYEPKSWETPDTILGKLTPTLKVAAFDLDSTLITTKSRAKFPKSPSDWRLLNSRVPSVFTSLAEEDYLIVIFTNQAGVSNGRINESFIRARLDGILAALKVEVGVFVATGRGNFRKPATGMWDILVQMIGGLERIDLKHSFYVGDAAGRPARQGHSADFSDSDLKFAINISLPFRTPEQYFGGKAAEAVAMDVVHGFDPRLILDAPGGHAYIDDRTDLDMLLRTVLTPVHLVDELHLGSSHTDELPAVQTMVLMHGFPASGKTSFVKRHLIPRGFIWVNQDTFHTYARCARVTRDALARGKSVVIDNTNPNRNARKKYIDLAKMHDPNLKIVCIVMKTARDVAQHLNIIRERETMGETPHVPAVAFHAYQKGLQLPELNESIDRIGEVRFLPCFTTEHDRYMFSRLT